MIHGVSDKLNIYVKRIIDDSVAGCDGRILVNDHIVEVNGISLVGVSQKLAAQTLSNCAVCPETGRLVMSSFASFIFLKSATWIFSISFQFVVLFLPSHFKSNFKLVKSVPLLTSFSVASLASGPFSVVSSQPDFCLPDYFITSHCRQSHSFLPYPCSGPRFRMSQISSYRDGTFRLGKALQGRSF